jgi:uncharacterized membrane protein YfcA
MQIYLPIAELSVSVFYLLAIGGGVGLLSGLIGVGGGFLLTPLLIFIGIPPTIAVGTGSNQVVAASVSGALAHWRRGNVDLAMGAVLLAGGIVGSTLGVWIFRVLRALGQIDLVISLFYVVFLSAIGFLMLVESVRAWQRSRNPSAPRRKLHQHYLVHRLPLRMRFRRSKLYISALVPFGLGLIAGVLTAIMGVGGGFLMVPAMIYLVGMPTSVVVGTSLFQIIFVTANVTFLQAVGTHTVDLILAAVLMVGSVIGAQFGTRLGVKLRGEHLRALMGLIVLAIAARVAWTLVVTPDDPFFLAPVAS